MSEAALLAALSSDSNIIQDVAVEQPAHQSPATEADTQSLLAALDAPANLTSSTKRPASLEADIPGAKRIKVEPEDARLATPGHLDTSIPTSTDALMTPAIPPPSAPAPSAAPTTTATTSAPQMAASTVSNSAAQAASIAPTPHMPSPTSAHPQSHEPTPTATTSASAAAPSPATPIPSIEKSPSVKPEPGKDTATPDSAKGKATPDAPPATGEAPRAAPTAPPRKRRRLLEAPGQALRGMNMQLLGIQAVQVLEWLSQEPFEEIIDALRDVESEVSASYSFKVSQFEQAWRNFSMTEDVLEWSKMGLGDQKHRKTVRLANLARFAIDLFSEDETCLPSLHERFFRVFVYGTRKFSVDHSNILLELKTQLALHLLEEGGKEKAPADLLQEVFMDGLETQLKGRSWYPEKFEEEAAMLTSAEIRMSLLLSEYEESGSNTATLTERYPYDNLLKQLGSYMHSELVAHSDHCQTLIFSSSSRSTEKRPAENRSLAYQDDDDYWERTSKLIDNIAASIATDMDSKESEKDPNSNPTATTSNGTAPEPNAQPATTSNGVAQNGQANTASSTAPASSTGTPVELPEQLKTDIDKLKEFVSQKVAAREAEIARASRPPTPQAPVPALDQTVQNLYLLNKATHSQQPVYSPRASSTPQAQPPTPAGGPHLPIQGHPQGHMPHVPRPVGGVVNQTAGAGQSSEPLAPGELPPNQTCPTSMLYDKARQAALSKSATHTRREGIHSTRRPWTPEEEKALMTGLDMVKGPHWSQILSLFGVSGSISDVLKDRTQVQLKDKARNLKLFFLKTQSEMPYYLSAVTGELKTRAPNQAARKEAEERARLSREGDQAKAQGNMAALVGQLQNAHHQAQGSQSDPARQQQHGQQQPQHQYHQQPHQPQQQQQQHHTGVVTPAQAALAAHITTPAMAQGQAQSAQRPIQAAHPTPATMASKEPQTATASSSPMVTPSAHGGTVSAPVAQSQPHNRPSDGTVAALQELAKASASPVSATHTPRMQSQPPGQGQPRATSSGLSSHVQSQAQTQNQAQTPAQKQVHHATPQPQLQQPQAQGQPQQIHQQARVTASPGVPAQASTPATSTPSMAAAKTTAIPSPAPATQEHRPSATTAGAAPTSTSAKPHVPATTASSKTPAPTSGPSASSSGPAASALQQLQNSRSTPVTLSQSFPSTIPANLFSRVTEAEATNAGLLERLRAEMARETRS